MKFEIPLKVGTALTSSIPYLIAKWTPEDFIAWLKSIEVRSIDEYSAKISDPKNGYDGKWLWRRKDSSKELGKIFTLTADLDDVMFELESWMKAHQ